MWHHFVLRSQHKDFKAATLSKGSSSHPAFFFFWTFPLLYFDNETGSQNICVSGNRAAGHFHSPFPLHFCLSKTLKFLFLVMPPGSRDDRHRPHPGRILGKTGHHGHVNHPPAQHSHPCPPPTHINRAGCATQHSGDFWSVACVIAVHTVITHARTGNYATVAVLSTPAIVFISKRSPLSAKTHKCLRINTRVQQYFGCLSPAGGCCDWTWLGVPGNRTPTQCWGPAVWDRCVFWAQFCPWRQSNGIYTMI